MPEPLPLAQLQRNQALTHGIYAVDGEQLLRTGQIFDDACSDLFGKSGLDSFFRPAKGESEEDCSVALRFEVKDILNLAETDVLGLPIADDKGRLLVQAGMTVSRTHRDNLIRVGVHTVHVRRPADPVLAAKSKKLRQELRAIAKERATTRLGSVFEKNTVQLSRLMQEPEKMTETRVVKAAETDTARTVAIDRTVRSLAEPPRLTVPESQDDLERVCTARKDLLTSAQNIIATIGEGRSLDGKLIGQFAKQVVSSLVSDRFHRLHLIEAGEESMYLAAHSLTTMVLAVNVAARLGYALEEVLELAYGAFLHDIGMLRVDKRLLDKAEPLEPIEVAQIRKHPVYGLEFCQKIRNLPLSTPIIILQENERIDGSGYPKGKGVAKLHPYARIVTVAACYDAMTRKRPWRPAKEPYTAMRELLTEVQANRLDADAVRALLETLSLFPIGSGVKLSDGHVGYVLDAAGQAYTRPVIAIEHGPDGTPLNTTRVVDLEDPAHKTVKITEPLSRSSYTRRIQ